MPARPGPESAGGATAIPPMVPSAEERLDGEPATIVRLHDCPARRLFLDTGVIALQERAYRDGYAAASCANGDLIAALKEIVQIAKATEAETLNAPNAPGWTSVCAIAVKARAAIARALRDHTQESGHE